MTTSFFQATESTIQGRLTESTDWQDLDSNSAGPFIGKAVTQRVCEEFKIEVSDVDQIEKNTEHPKFSYYWSVVTSLAAQASEELQLCDASLKDS